MRGSLRPDGLLVSPQRRRQGYFPMGIPDTRHTMGRQSEVDELGWHFEWVGWKSILRTVSFALSARLIGELHG